MKLLFNKIIFLVLLVIAFPAATQDVSPDTLIKNTVDEVITILNQDDGIRAGNQDKVLNLIREKILPHFNFIRMTQLAMGKNWSLAGPDQKKSLVKEFRTLLVRTYSISLTSYRDEIIKVSPSNVNPQDTRATVKTQVIQGSGKQPVPIDYSMEKSSNGWKVYDVTVAGVSLVTNYRGTFNSQIRNGGVDGLITTLVEKNTSMQGK
ncbi:phospholipid transport system substrate-binding protein [Nitrosomonas eutropha]|uniref:Phospholipid transport system substrate-binding protein n=1 Tax=Nitrosomonas eutropha TaxID=916 RepID=A0A1I7IVG7_9PROT|nr:ABC transporter substrate-binding protein [Nitrosomonas eutropha]SFU76913.1 phospholipid transport system substrate-binding protein [Nitrosomonas eutropha]